MKKTRLAKKKKIEVNFTKMRNTIKLVILSCLLLTIGLFATSCTKDLSPYGDLNDEGYTVSIKYDANGGLFTTNTETIIDTYNLEEYQTNAEGKKEIKLFAPDASIRGGQAYTASKNDCFLAGWYTEKTEIKDASGNVIGYNYGGRWNFESDKYAVMPSENYDSATPVLTLYAAWVPAFTYEFYTFDESGAEVLIDTVTKNPLADTTIKLPAFDEETGKVNAPNDFPVLEDATYGKIYTDKEMTKELTSETLSHIGKFVPENATLENETMKIYCATTDGVQYEISTPKQLIDSADSNAHYTLKCDLDFSENLWPQALATNTFTGKINGNGFAIKNVKVTQNNGENKFFGLLGIISKDASVSDIVFDNIMVNINSGSRNENAKFGILAAEIEEGSSVSGVTLQNSKIVIAKNATLFVAVSNYVHKFGIVCAEGQTSGITFSTDNVTVAFSESGRYSYTYTLDENGYFTLVPVSD